MADQLVTYHCPECNAPIEVKPGKKIYYCIYCGSQINVVSDSKEFTYNKNINVNKVQRFESSADEQKTERQKNRMQIIKWCIIAYFGLCLFALLSTLVMQSFLH